MDLDEDLKRKAWIYRFENRSTKEVMGFSRLGMGTLPFDEKSYAWS